MGPKRGLGRAESEVLRRIAERHPISVRDVAEQFADVRKTTVLNMMERLRAKGFLARALTDGVFLYSPTQPQTTVMRSLVADFVESMLDGSLEPFAAYLAEKETLSAAEMAQLQDLLAKMDEKS